MRNLEEIKSRIPMIQDYHFELYRRIVENPAAPAFNSQCGDRLQELDFEILDQFNSDLKRAEIYKPDTVWLERYIETQALNSPYFFRSREAGLADAQVMTRNDIRDRLHEIVPLNADLSGLILNPTSGTTGMPVQVPNTPLGVGHYQPIILEAIRRHGVELNPSNGDMAAVQICSQRHTMTYGTVHAYYDGAGFAKINLPPEGREALLGDWSAKDHPDRFLKDLRPMILSGDPFAFQVYMDYGIDFHPRAVLSTASTLSAELRNRMESYFECPVIDLYSSNETGPVAASCSQHSNRFHQLSSDIFLEVLSDQGVATSGEGELLVSGGRNPLLPLLRYNTGDRCYLSQEACSCGAQGFMEGFQGRPTVFFHSAAGRRINPLDFARMLRFVPAKRHRLQQNSDGTMDVFVDPGSFELETYSEEIVKKGMELLAGGIVRVHPWDPALEKDYPYEVVE
ncbi:MAG: hypothetical protein RH862_03215 [Leptospiraceae bacterium]